MRVTDWKGQKQEVWALKSPGLALGALLQKTPGPVGVTASTAPGDPGKVPARVDHRVASLLLGVGQGAAPEPSCCRSQKEGLAAAASGLWQVPRAVGLEGA